MRNNPYPLLFKPVYKDYIWGGKRIARLPGRSAGPAKRAESWEISDRPEGMSVVTNGRLKDYTLQELVKGLGSILTGTRSNTKNFPLLVKLIDASEKLSIQVHPNARAARTLKAEPKTEAWYVVDAKPGACIYSLKPGVPKKALVTSLKNGTAEKLMKRLPVKKGLTYFIPAGTVHAIGAGCLIMEIQQSSNTTYRLFDWNRKGTDGKPRQLHINESLKSINWKGCSPEKARPLLLERNKFASLYNIMICKYFVIEKLVAADNVMIKQGTESFVIIFNPAGDVAIETAGNPDVILKKGMTCLIPAALTQYALKPLSGKSELILSRLP